MDVDIQNGKMIISSLHKEKRNGKNNPYYKSIIYTGKNTPIYHNAINAVVFLRQIVKFLKSDEFKNCNINNLDNQIKLLINYFSVLKCSGLFTHPKDCPSPLMRGYGVEVALNFLRHHLLHVCVANRSFSQEFFSELLNFDNLTLTDDMLLNCDRAMVKKILTDSMIKSLFFSNLKESDYLF